MNSSAEIRYDFIKSPECREITVDGVHGGVGPNGRINMVLFTERNHIPASITHAADAGGKAVEEVSRDARDGVVRIVGTVALLDLAAAKAVHAFLEQQIRELSASK